MLLGNVPLNYLYFAIAFVLSICISVLIKYIIVKKIKSFIERTKNGFDDVLLSYFSSINIVFYVFVSFYIAIQFLVLNEFVKKILEAIFIIFVIHQVSVAIQVFLDYALKKRISEGNGAQIEHIKDIIQFGIRVAFWSFGILFILSNLGVNITSLIAGLGIGGVAIALAVQSILGDLFSYFAIYFDKPFIRGDFIVIGPHAGVIEKVGIKTTRIRALQGEEIIISNSELTSSRVQNFKRMEERRILFSFGVLYETPLETLEKIPQLMQDIVTSVELTRFDRAHLFGFGDSAYTYEVVYFVLSSDYNQYMDIHQSINLHIIKAFAKEQIQFAYPTRTVHLTHG